MKRYSATVNCTEETMIGGGLETMTLSEPYDIARGVLQGDIFSPVAFIAGLDRIFRMHDLQNPGVAVGVGESTTMGQYYKRFSNMY